METEESFSEGGTSSSSTSTNQLPLASPRRSFECPICLDTTEDETSVGWCRHAFCFPCIVAWACLSPVCPICQEPFKYIFRKVGDTNYEVYFSRPTRRNRGRRTHRRSAERRRRNSTGRRQRSSSRRDRGSGRAGDRERDRSRSQRRNRDGHSRGQQAQDYDPSSSRRRQYSRRQQYRRRWQSSRAHSSTSETSSGWDQASRQEQDLPGHSGRGEHHQQVQWASFRESRATRSQSQRRPHSTLPQTQTEEQRRMDHDAGQSERHEEETPSSSGRSEHH